MMGTLCIGRKEVRPIGENMVYVRVVDHCNGGEREIILSLSPSNTTNHPANVFAQFLNDL
jgi:hypothetical protein